MDEAVGQPGKDVEDCGLVRRKDVGEVGAVKDVFEGRKHTYPDRRAPGGRDETVGELISVRSCMTEMNGHLDESSYPARSDERSMRGDLRA